MRDRIAAGVLLLALALASASAAQEIRRGAIDPEVSFSNRSLSLLVSQIGYADPGLRVAFLMARDRAAGEAVDRYTVEDPAGTTVLSGRPAYAGFWVTAHFWRLDLSGLRAPGSFRLRAGGLASHRFPVTGPRQLYLDALLPDLVFAQLGARRRDDAIGGYVDSGNDIRETNSHGVVVAGLLDLVERQGDWLDPADRAALESHLEHLWRFLVDQQDADGRFLGGWDRGTPIRDGRWPNHLRAVLALSRLARHFAVGNPPLAAMALEAAGRGETFSQANFDPASEHSAFLLERVEAAAAYHLASGDPDALAAAGDALAELKRRQAAPGPPLPAGLGGLFAEYRDAPGWCRLNHHDYGPPTGAYDALPLSGLGELLRRYPDHPDAESWRQTAGRFLSGFLAAAAAESPFGLVANGLYPDLRWFSDLYHGMSMTYGLAAAGALEFEAILDRPAFSDLAERQLLWIAGLNTGSPFPDGAEPFSCLVGHGYQWLRDGHGAFPDIPGSIVNGLSATPQFVRTMPPGDEQPSYLCDESWLAHTGAWLSAVSRLLCSRLRAGNDLRLARAGGSIEFTWRAVPGANAYRLRRDGLPGGPFASVAARVEGATGVTLALDPEPLVYYRLAGEAANCEGPH